MLKIYNEILGERRVQDAEWGGAVQDDKHSQFDWIVYIVKHLGKSVIWNRPSSHILKTFRYQMIRVAALAVASIEWTDRILKEEK